MTEQNSINDDDIFVYDEKNGHERIYTFAKKGPDGVFRSLYSNKTVEELQAEDLRGNYPNMRLSKYSDYVEKENKYHLEQYLTTSKEISEERYNDMLEVLPPMGYQNTNGNITSFMISEATTGNIHAFFMKIRENGNSRYFEGYARTTDKRIKTINRFLNNAGLKEIPTQKEIAEPA